MLLKQTILIVDDQLVNRRILEKILKDDYRVIPAENGRQALEILRGQPQEIAAVILDVVMPEMNGYEMLEVLRQEEKLTQIPVIVASQGGTKETERKAFSLGAVDYVSKPYVPEILKIRLRYAIERRKNPVQGSLQNDLLTGLYSKDLFYAQVESVLAQNPGRRYDLVCADVDYFKLINDVFGREKGDALLCKIAAVLRQSAQEKDGFAARMQADTFMMFLPRNAMYESSIKQDVAAIFDVQLLPVSIKLRFGIYPVNDPSLLVAGMCDRAKLAADTIKGRYGYSYAIYDDSIWQKLIREQCITDSMSGALRQEQFKVFLQPKYDLVNGKIVGAEALVRWVHPQKGCLSPAEFIPLFERNGFITELDQYVWDKTCEVISNWIRAGKKYVPVSVNVSRADIYNENLPEILNAIIRKHGLKPNQLHLEITETAYTENPDQLISVVGTLKKLGFSIEMDDFGSGYSSLNMLSELPINILKLDMKFIQNTPTNEHSQSNILSFIIGLAKWMNLLVVAEGVETKEQVDLLRHLHCNYVQGYFYAKPMSSDDFAMLLMKSDISDQIDRNAMDDHEGEVTVSDAKSEKIMLIVDDVKMNRAVLSSFFAEKYTIVEADNGQIAFDYLEQHYPEIEVILLDLDMPVMDGYEFLEVLKGNQMFQNIPVIVTKEKEASCVGKAFALGADEIISMPYNVNVVTRRVSNAIAGRKVQFLDGKNVNLR